MKTSRMGKKEMCRFPRLFPALAILVVWLTTSLTAEAQYLIANNNVGGPWSNSASIFSIASDGSVTLVKTIPTLSGGINDSEDFGGNYAYVSKIGDCAYIGDGLGKYATPPGDLAAINMSTLTLVDKYPGLRLDNGDNWGVQLAGTLDGNYLFAAFTESNTITTYQREPGCALKKVSQIITVGARSSLSLGRVCCSVQGMKVTPNGNFLILTYGDGSFGSYKIDPNTGALSLIARYLVTDRAIVEGIDITSDSRWVVFGAGSTSGTEVEVAAIHQDGTLGPTIGYSGLGSGIGSSTIWLSPDETILYIGNNYSGQITAVPFNRTTSVVGVSKACTSPVFNVINGTTYLYVSGLTGSSGSPTGSPLYATLPSGNSGVPSAIVIVNFEKPCTLTVSPNSPVTFSGSSLLVGVATDPPRSF